MLNMIKGCRVCNPELLYEGYETTEFGFVANVDADKLQSLFESFVKLHNEDCFLNLEVPSNEKVEIALRTDNTSPMQKDVYYMDGLSPQQALDILDAFGLWLLQDGVSCFGIGLHSGCGEILAGKYNVVSVYTKDSRKYAGFFEKHGIEPVAQLKTAWDYFTEDTPGEAFLYSHKGKIIYDLVEHLKPFGLYFAERREERFSRNVAIMQDSLDFPQSV